MRRNGFTLIELLITILVIGILMVVGFYTFGRVEDIAKNRRAEGNLRASFNNVYVEYDKGRKLPSSGTLLTRLNTQNGNQYEFMPTTGNPIDSLTNDKQIRVAYIQVEAGASDAKFPGPDGDSDGNPDYYYSDQKICMDNRSDTGRTYAFEADLDSDRPDAIRLIKGGVCGDDGVSTGGTPDTILDVRITSTPPTDITSTPWGIAGNDDTTQRFEFEIFGPRSDTVECMLETQSGVTLVAWKTCDEVADDVRTGAEDYAYPADYPASTVLHFIVRVTRGDKTATDDAYIAKYDHTPPIGAAISGGSLSWQSVPSITFTASGASDAESAADGITTGRYEFRTWLQTDSGWSAPQAYPLVIPGSGNFPNRTHDVTDEGQTIVQARACGGYNGEYCSSWVESHTHASPAANATARIDRTPPVLTNPRFTPNGYKLDVNTGALDLLWYNPSITSAENQRFTMDSNATDNLSGVANVTFPSITGLGASSINGTFVDTTASGTNYSTAANAYRVGTGATVNSNAVQIRATDNAGNVGTINVSMRPDSTAPTPTTIISLPSGCTNAASMTATWSGSTDSDSGIDGGNTTQSGGYFYRYSYQGGAFTAWTRVSTVSGLQSFSAQGDYVLQVKVVDDVGNEWVPAGSSFGMDRTPPTTPSVSSSVGNPNQWYSVPSITLTASSVDSYCGNSSITYANTGSGAWSAFAPANQTYTRVAEGSQNVSFQARDALGNTSGVGAANIYIDRTPPTSTSGFPLSPYSGLNCTGYWIHGNGYGYQSNGNLNCYTHVGYLIARATGLNDALSGVVRVDWYRSGVLIAQPGASNGSNSDVAIWDQGGYTMTARIVDAAGNYSDRVFNVNLDTVAPPTPGGLDIVNPGAAGTGNGKAACWGGGACDGPLGRFSDSRHMVWMTWAGAGDPTSGTAGYDLNTCVIPNWVDNCGPSEPVSSAIAGVVTGGTDYPWNVCPPDDNNCGLYDYMWSVRSYDNAGNVSAPASPVRAGTGPVNAEGDGYHRGYCTSGGCWNNTLGFTANTLSGGSFANATGRYKSAPESIRYNNNSANNRSSTMGFVRTSAQRYCSAIWWQYVDATGGSNNGFIGNPSNWARHGTVYTIGYDGLNFWYRNVMIGISPGGVSDLNGLAGTNLRFGWRANPSGVGTAWMDSVTVLCTV